MKTWAKILVWLCTGAGIGFFAGYRAGHKAGYKKADYDLNSSFMSGYRIGNRHAERDKIADDASELEMECHANDALNTYRGDDYEDLNSVNGIDEILRKPVNTDMDGDELTPVPDEDPEMPMDLPTIDDDEPHVVPQLHPTQLLPKIVSEEEYYRNPWEFEEEKLIFYELDEVVYNCTTQSIVEYPDNVLGVGTLLEFHIPPNEPPKEVIFVINEIFGTRFRIDSIDAAFCDEVDGTIHPEDDPPEGEDDYWNDV